MPRKFSNGSRPFLPDAADFLFALRIDPMEEDISGNAAATASEPVPKSNSVT